MRALAPAGPHRARLQRRHLDAEGRSLERDTFGETADAPLGGEVGSVARKGRASAQRGDLDDVPATLLAHHGKGRTREVHAAEQAGLDQLWKVVRRNLLEG